jgi:DNA polymerase-3 subunit alpha
MDKFAHLHLHTEYSFLDGYSKVWDTPSKSKGKLITRLEEIGQEYCAITDHGSTAGWIRFDKACKGSNIKPVFGVEGYYCNDRFTKGLTEEQKLKAIRGITNPSEKKKAVKAYEKKLGLSRRSHFVALAMNGKGLIEINNTLSLAATEGFYYRPRWDWDLAKRLDNCIISSACAGGIINWHLQIDDFENKDEESAWEEAKKWKKHFKDRFYIELMSIDWPRQELVDKISYKIAKDLDIPMIITNDSHYAYPEDWEAHDILLAIQSTRWEDLNSKDVLNDPNRMRYDMQDLYVKTRKEMFKSFRKHHKWMPKEEITLALNNTLEIAEMCHHDINKKSMIMPVFDVPEVNLNKKYDDKTKLERYFLKLVFRGWKKKIIPHIPEDKISTYKKRLNSELKQIMKQGFTPYFVLCNKLMKWVDSQGIARGPARGSSAGSLVAYLMDMTMVDPIPFNLLFSRFIDPNRTDYPDVDMDFEDTRRHEVVQYFMDTYGSDKVAILGNNMIFKAKMSLKDVARLYHVNLKETQDVCDLVVERSGADSRLSFCLADTFEHMKNAQVYKKNYPKVVKFASELEGLTKQQGVHAAGVVISDVPMTEYTALRRFDKNSEFRVTMIDKHDAEDIGLLKMDVLGLNTMGIISECKKLIKENHGEDIDLEDLCRDVAYNGGDKEVYEAFARAETIGIFQFSSQGLTRLSYLMKIDKFSEISDATALHRPGPIHSGAMNQYPSYKFGKVEKAKSIHPIIDKWTKSTYGLIIYQEQVMQIVRELGGFSWAQTNTVRKVMSKSGGAEYFMKTFWPTWKKNCAKQGMDEKTALKAFKKIMSFGSWAFNLSHSVSYALVSYMCMWFKVKYPVEYVTAFLNTVNDSKGFKITAMIKEAQRLDIPIKEVNINYSGSKFKIVDGSIVCGLSDVKRVGQKAVDTIVEHQPFKGLLHFIRVTDNRACNKGAIESLIKSGAFDDFKYNKKKLLEHLPDIIKWYKGKTDKSKDKARALIKECKGTEGLSKQDVAEMKRSVSPMSVGKHVSQFFGDVIKRFDKHVTITKLKDIVIDDDAAKRKKRKDFYILGLLTQVDLKRLSQEVKEVIDASQEKRYALGNLEDETDFIVMSFRDQVYERYEHNLYPWRNKVLLVQGEVTVGMKKLYVNKVWVMEDLRKKSGLDFEQKYLFKHPIKRWLGKQLKPYRKQKGIKTINSIVNGEKVESRWCLGYVSNIMSKKITNSNSEHYLKEFHIVTFEDETSQGYFMIHPNDKRFRKMRRIFHDLYSDQKPFLLLVQRNYKFEPGSEVKGLNISIDKRIKIEDCIKTPFKFKE